MAWSIAVDHHHCVRHVVHEIGCSCYVQTFCGGTVTGRRYPPFLLLSSHLCTTVAMGLSPFFLKTHVGLLHRPVCTGKSPSGHRLVCIGKSCPHAGQFVVASQQHAVGIMPRWYLAGLGICPVKMVPCLLGNAPMHAHPTIFRSVLPPKWCLKRPILQGKQHPT